MSDQVTPTSDITSDDKLWALLSYLLTPIVPIIVLLMEDKKSRPFLKAHYMQALVLGVVLWVINFALSFIIIGCVTSVLTLILLIVYGVKAYKGEYITIPVVTNFVKNQGWA
jgi:uncharacterized membrane protein